MRYLHSILLLFIISGLQINAQDFKFYATGTDTAYLNENYKVVFVIENAKQVSNFRPPSFDGFQVVSEQQGSSTVNINGKISQSYYLTYYLQPQREGSFLIEQANAQINGKAENTEAFEVFIKPARKQNSPKTITQENSTKKNYNEDIFIRLTTNNTAPFVGEAFTVTAKIYFKINIRDLYPLKIPEFKNFWSNETKIEQKEKKIETYNGQQYYTVELYKYTLIPLKEGNLTISPLEFNSIIEAQVLKSHPFWGKYYDYDILEHKVLCNSLTINAQVLPKVNQPEYFNGAVGNYKLTTNYDTDTVEYNQAINLTAKISGTGNFSMFNSPHIELPDNFEIYDPEIIEDINLLNGSKTYKYIIVPKKPGSYKVSPISFSYFDVQTETYKTLNSDTITFNIGGELPPEITNEIKEDSIPENEIYTIVSTTTFKKSKDSFYGSKIYYTAITSPLLFFAFIFFAKRMRENSLVDIVALKKKRASKEAQKRLKKAHNYLIQENKEAFYTEIFDALNGYVSDKLNITQADLSKELIISKFTEKNVSELLAQQFIQVLSNAEAALYAPTTSSKMKEDYETAINWIVEIEHEIN